MKGKNHPNYGKKMSEEQKQKISKTMTGRKRNSLINTFKGNFKKGLKLSQETKDKISKAMTGKKRGPLSEETKEKIREKSKLYIFKNHDANKKPVGKYTTDNILIETYNSIKETCIQNNIKQTTLSRACNNPSKHTLFNGFIFKFIS
jgi:hypothetical protein